MDPFDNEVLNIFCVTNIENVTRAVDLVNLVHNNIPRKYKVQERIDPFIKYDDVEFERRYRMNKALAWNLYELINGANTLEPKVKYYHSYSHIQPILN